MLIGVSTDYYIRLEQGRERHPSDQVISALAEVFNLGTDALAHLYALARGDLPADPEPGPPDGGHGQVSPNLIRLSGQLAPDPGLRGQPVHGGAWP